jgi:hypothetical protein
VVLGSFSFAAFFLMLALVVEPGGLLLGFAAAILAALAVQGVALRAVERRPVGSR